MNNILKFWFCKCKSLFVRFSRWYDFTFRFACGYDSDGSFWWYHPDMFKNKD